MGRSMLDDVVVVVGVAVVAVGVVVADDLEPMWVIDDRC